MELYLIRHGVAAERGDAYPDDTQRPLTREGVAKVRKEGAGFTAFGIRFDLILTSPLVRARQTAEAFADALPEAMPVKVVSSLSPGAAFAAVREDLARHSGATRIALVGHEPDMGRLAARLIGARAPIPFKKGAICRIDVEAVPPAGPGILRWFVTPKMLRRLS